jgi:hypothetical protein
MYKLKDYYLLTFINTSYLLKAGQLPHPAYARMGLAE